DVRAAAGEAAMSPKKPRTWKTHKPRRKGAVTGMEWVALSHKVFAREGWRCLSCRKLKPLTAHHVVARSAGGRDEVSNLVALCGGPSGCHERVQSKWRDHVTQFQLYLAGLGDYLPPAA